MKKIIKDGLKVLGDYAVSLVMFVIFLYMFLMITKENYSKWIPLYSGIIFIMMASMIYTDMKKLAIKEKRPQYDLNPYPLKGFILGFIGFLPIITIEVVYLFLDFNTGLGNRVKELILKTILGPVYFSVRLFGGSAIAYVVASLIVPIVAMLGYLAGYYGIDLKKKRYANKCADKSVVK